MLFGTRLPLSLPGICGPRHSAAPKHARSFWRNSTSSRATRDEMFQLIEKELTDTDLEW
jgi:hypothetical protein